MISLSIDEAAGDSVAQHADEISNQDLSIRAQFRVEIASLLIKMKERIRGDDLDCWWFSEWFIACCLFTP
jgi:hypothetical protein